MTKILVSTLILLLISSSQGFSQKKVPVWRYEGPRIGLDLSRFLIPYMQKGSRNGWEIQADVPYKGNWFPTFEFGMQWFDDKHDGFRYKNNGTYARVGVDMNIVKFESLKDHDLVFYRGALWLFHLQSGNEWYWLFKLLGINYIVCPQTNDECSLGRAGFWDERGNFQ